MSGVCIERVFNVVFTDLFPLTCLGNALRWMQWNLVYDKSILALVMAWCRRASSCYLSQCWPRFKLPYGVTRPEWVKCVYMWFIVYVVSVFRLIAPVGIWNAALFQPNQSGPLISAQAVVQITRSRVYGLMPVWAAFISRIHWLAWNWYGLWNHYAVMVW